MHELGKGHQCPVPDSVYLSHVSQEYLRMPGGRIPCMLMLPTGKIPIREDPEKESLDVGGSELQAMVGVKVPDARIDCLS